ncbi:hypothetical protein GR183_15035 [Stappia sp. GBMRC 2046]|uniref:Uncharacterized protein n=1 Tax=Stappia sediminis TaxID=2692190 RepID=A0A7X3LW92_9HYPH|nr:hypothetical protein [Stappia sediminis]MXN66228.1 hypothetical protein [Stappia sediminis]
MVRVSSRAIVAAACLIAAAVAPLRISSAQEDGAVTLGGEISSGKARNGNITFHLEMAKDPASAEQVPLLSIVYRGRQVLRQFGSPGGFGGPYGSARFAEVDNSNDTPEVIFSTFSGGAHCCTQMQVATKAGPISWTMVDLGAWDGEGPTVSDLDGDGTGEFSTVDQRFLYAFDCYACSAAPKQILAIRDGRLEDVSRQDRFRQVQERHLARMIDWQRQAAQPGQEFSPGFYAGYVAQSALLGKGSRAWEEMLSAYSPSRDPGYEMCRNQPYPGQCGPDEKMQVGFPEALRSFLKAFGYDF